MRQMTSMRRLGSKSRLLGVALAAALLPAACANPFDTSVENPNAVVEEALGDPAGATTLVNGLGGSVTRALTGIYGPYHTATDELTWVGSRGSGQHGRDVRLRHYDGHPRAHHRAGHQ